MSILVARWLPTRTKGKESRRKNDVYSLISLFESSSFSSSSRRLRRATINDQRSTTIIKHDKTRFPAILCYTRGDGQRRTVHPIVHSMCFHSPTIRIIQCVHVQSLKCTSTDTLVLLLATVPHTPAVYPYSSTAHFPTPTTPSPAPRNLLKPRKGWSLILHQNAHFRSEADPQGLLGTMFSRRDPNRVLPGSILTINTWASTRKTRSTAFSGVLIGVRRRGIDTSVRVRNIIGRVGVETNFKIYSPLIRDVSVVRRAGTRHGPKAFRQSKAYFVRERPELLKSISEK